MNASFRKYKQRVSVAHLHGRDVRSKSGHNQRVNVMKEKFKSGIALSKCM